MFASRRYNAIRCHGRDLALGARTHARGRACVCVVRALRGVEGVGTHAAQHWLQRAAQRLVAGKVQTNRVSIARLITLK